MRRGSVAKLDWNTLPYVIVTKAPVGLTQSSVQCVSGASYPRGVTLPHHEALHILSSAEITNAPISRTSSWRVLQSMRSALPFDNKFFWTLNVECQLSFFCHSKANGIPDGTSVNGFLVSQTWSSRFMWGERVDRGELHHICTPIGRVT
jgi:hypothetical protein